MRFPYHGAGILLYRVKDNNAEVLLGKRTKSPFKGRYCVPGGFREKGESDLECSKRELFEETGIRLSDDVVLKRLFSLRFPFFSWKTFYIQVKGDYDLEADEFSYLGWFSLKEAGTLRKRPFSAVELRRIERKIKEGC